MNVNVIDNQLLESLNNYFDTLSKTGYIKNSNSEALLVLSFLQEITSDYTDLVTFLNSLSENYCIIPFLDLSTCKVNLNSSDQLVRFTANLDNISAYINTSYLDNQLINFPYMAITGKSIQINDILVPDLNNNSSSLFSNSSKFYLSSLVMDSEDIYGDIFNQASLLPITIDHESDNHNIEIILKYLPEYKVNFVFGVDSTGVIDISTAIRNICMAHINRNTFDVAHTGDIVTTTHYNSGKATYSARVALTTSVNFSTHGNGDLIIGNSASIPNELAYVVGSVVSLSEIYNTALLERNEYSGNTYYRSPVFLYQDSQEAISTNADSSMLPLSPNGIINAYTCNITPSSNSSDSCYYLLTKQKVSKAFLASINYSKSGGYSVSSNYIGVEYNTDSVLLLSHNKDNLIIPTTRDDGSAEDIIGDGIELSSFYASNEEFTYVQNTLTDTYKLSTLTQNSKDTLLWCGKAFTGSIFKQDFRSPDTTTLVLTDVAVVNGDTAELKTVDCKISTVAKSANVTEVTITFTDNTAFSRRYYLKIGGHIQYNTTTVNITGNIGNMKVNIEGEGTVSLPATITVNRP